MRLAVHAACRLKLELAGQIGEPRDIAYSLARLLE